MTRYPGKRNFTVRNNEIVYTNESPLITHILGTLGNIRIKAWRNNTTGIWDAKKKKWRKFKNQLRGVSDILGILPDGKFLAIECKTKNTARSKEQQDFIVDINNTGGTGLFAMTVDDVLEILKEKKYIEWDGYQIKRNY